MNKRARKNAKSDKAPASNLKEALTLGGALFEREVHVAVSYTHLTLPTNSLV